MSYQGLARKWRPQGFEDVVGQEHVTRTLGNAITSGRLAQAYLFSGPRGVGKTTTARILAKALNCGASPRPTATPCGTCLSCRDIVAGSSVDVLEIDGASNTGVDDVRELREQVKYVPFQGRFKVYIIDEVHMLSNAAFNALLKTLEEPPPHLLFVFATTESHKILPTILSRCQHFRFRRVARLDMMARLSTVATAEGFEVDERALALIAKVSEGSVRDALSVVDQVVAASGPIVREADVVALLGIVDREGFAALTRAILDKDPAGAIAASRTLFDHGHDVKLLCAELVEYIRNVTMTKLGERTADTLDLPREEIKELCATASGLELDELQRLFTVFSQAQEDIRFAVYPPFTLEMAMVKATRVVPLQSIDELIARVEALGVGGDRPPPPIDPKSRRGKEDHPPESRAVPRSVSGSGVAGRPPVQAPRPGSPEVGASDAAALWSTAMRRVADEKPNLEAYLGKGRAVASASDELILEYDAADGWAADLAAREDNQTYIKAVLREIAGAEVMFRIKRSEVSTQGGNAERLAEPGRGLEDTSSRRTVVADVLRHPVVREVVEIFDGEVMEVRDLDQRDGSRTSHA